MDNKPLTIGIEHNLVELDIKKSRFIGEIFFVKSAEEIKPLIENVRSENSKATHVTYAYRVGFNQIQEGMSDDGEPQGTAGKPILKAIQGRNLTDVIVFVTRYFGGIKLGAGGLIRAYSNSALEVIDNTELIEIKTLTKISIKFPYSKVNDIKYFLEQEKIVILSENYNLQVNFILEVESSSVSNFQQELEEKFQNSIPVQILGTDLSV
ncbi:MAG: YigZ family protein [Lactobacillaceae bacterium]|jgi:uncharacterized YigZ family protein|nr:YigZ family protein [Lactobacillaceae bacterium]